MQKSDLNMILWKYFERPMTWIKDNWVPSEGDPYGDYPWFLLNKTRNTLSVAESPGYLADGQSLKEQAKAYGHDNTLSNMTVLFVSRIRIPQSVYSTWSALPNALLLSDAEDDQTDSSSDINGSPQPYRRSLRLQSQQSKLRKPAHKRARIDSDPDEETEVEEVVEQVQMSLKAKGKQKANPEKASDSEDGGGPSTLKLTRTLESIDLSRDEEIVDAPTTGNDTDGSPVAISDDDDDDRAIERGLLDFFSRSRSRSMPRASQSLPTPSNTDTAAPSSSNMASCSVLLATATSTSTLPVPDAPSQDVGLGARARRRANRPSIPRPKKSLW
ncbi:uncharacterized protein B0H18DRAFT_480758 [Fomitopsis serialis]|uniref:uncharacterized protein n=1 Tax=Fomitopsis serialis TaxID=139415 RepID=UPI0020085B8E|nr:uncharacterized protein B0H18DRAFT_480758 [Neoantrodia serialis]KAH9910317.1 hypothetical protein B0H18DRAFT_480758 [Neoantrodia serialis]